MALDTTNLVRVRRRKVDKDGKSTFTNAWVTKKTADQMRSKRDNISAKRDLNTSFKNNANLGRPEKQEGQATANRTPSKFRRMANSLGNRLTRGTRRMGMMGRSVKKR